MPSKKSKQARDPHAKREATRYANPIASREFIAQIIRNHGVPTTIERLIERLNLHSDSQRSALQARLAAMVRDG